MHLNTYQELAMEFNVLSDKTDIISYGVLNTASEAGEVAGKFAKAIRDGHPVDAEALLKEMGDVLWSLACLCEGLDTNLETVADLNILKLRQRQENGTISGSGDDR